MNVASQGKKTDALRKAGARGRQAKAERGARSHLAAPRASGLNAVNEMPSGWSPIPTAWKEGQGEEMHLEVRPISPTAESSPCAVRVKCVAVSVR